ncbi:replication initiation protein [Pseudomonas mosselii]|uniref:replication initiation protein n=1 Tax=Pseudomonas mosselii TaxID=78327 RepID=UPI002622DFCA|nr:replication initiation protein [Pseudomonas mosselii]MDN4500760.1 replication initiation protein [Pseudomonas mosselii]
MDFTPLSNSLSNSAAIKPQHTALQRILNEAPYLARCSDNKTAAKVRPREFAMRYPYMQINQRDMKAWLIFDLDHDHPYIWQDAALPPPNLIVRNRDTNAAHVFYAIEPVCTSVNGKRKPVAYMKAVYEAMAIRLNADKAYHSGPVAKTPGHPWWDTQELHGQEYSLGELADYLELETAPKWSTSPDVNSVSHSRHCILFELLRFYAYGIVNGERASGSFQSFSSRLEAYAHNNNAFGRYGFSVGQNSLPISSLRATVKSVADWTWSFYSGNGRCHRGVMDLDKALPLRKRQSLAAERTHTERQKATASKIRQACECIIKRGEKLTCIAIGAVARLSRQTVAKYKHVIEQVNSRQTPKVAHLEARISAPADVNYGAYQVSAKLPLCPLGAKGGANGVEACVLHEQLSSLALTGSALNPGTASCHGRLSAADVTPGRTVAKSKDKSIRTISEDHQGSGSPSRSFPVPEIVGSFCSLPLKLKNVKDPIRGF